MWSRSPTHTNRGTDCHRDARSNRHRDAGTHFHSYADLDTNAVLYAYAGAHFPGYANAVPNTNTGTHLHGCAIADLDTNTGTHLHGYANAVHHAYAGADFYRDTDAGNAGSTRRQGVFINRICRNGRAKGQRDIDRKRLRSDQRGSRLAI